MATTISILSTPMTYSVVNSIDVTGMFFDFNSSGSTQSGFQYVIQVNQLQYANNNLLQTLGRYNFPPRPNLGDGLFSVGKILRSVVGSNLTPTAIQPNGNPIVATYSEIYAKYNVQYGFSYDPNIVYYDMAVGSATFSVIIYISYTRPDIEVGDILTLTKTVTGYDPLLNGTTSVLGYINGAFTTSYTVLPGALGTSSLPYFNGLPAAYPAWYITVDKPGSDFVSLVPQGGLGGTITNQIRLTGTSSNLFAFNGTRQYNQLNYNFENTYMMGVASASFLTDYNTPYNNGFKLIYDNNWETVSFMADTSVNPVDTLNFTGYDSSFNVIVSSTIPLSVTQSYNFFTLGIGISNFLAGGYTLTNGVAAYSISIGSGGSFSQPLNRLINTNCTIFNIITLAFLNPYGGFDYWDFSLASTNTYTTARTEFKEVLPYNYNIGDRGRTILSQDVVQNWTINTDWITEYDSNYLKELIAFSPEVYQIIIDNGVVNKYPVIVSTPTYKVQTTYVDVLFFGTMDFSYAYPIITQNQ